MFHREDTLGKTQWNMLGEVDGEREVWVPDVINLRFCSDIQIVRNLVHSAFY